MRKLLSLIALALSLMTVARNAAAQETASPAPSKQEAAEQRKKAIELLNLTISEVRALKMPENRIFLLSQAADAAWNHDEKQARGWVQEIGESFKHVFRNPEENHPQVRLSWPRRQLRQQVIQMIARHDLDLALETLRYTRPVMPTGETIQQEFHAQEVALEQSLAAQAAAHNPAVALKLAEQTLEKGFSYELGRLVEIVAEKDRPAAEKLLGQSFKKLQNTKLLQDQPATQFALNLLQQEYRARMKELTPGQKMYGMKLRQPILSDDELKKWNELLCRTALSYQPTSESVKNPHSYELLTGVQRLLPEIEKLNPEYVALVNKSLSKLMPMLPDYAKDSVELNRFLQKGDVEGLLAAAEKAPKEKKDQYYRMAVFSAIDYHADTDLARKIINEYITDPYQKKNEIAFVEWITAQVKAGEDKIDEAVAALAGLENDMARADTMARIAEETLQKGNKKRATQLLEKAYQFLGDPIENAAQFGALARITKDFVDADPKRAFELYDPPIESLNQIISAITITCRYETVFNRCVSVKDELMLGYNNGYTQAIMTYIETMKSLGQVDFERAVELAGRFRNIEIRSYARLLLLAARLN